MRNLAWRIFQDAAAQFIGEAVATLQHTGLQGYNLDAEFSGDQNKSDGAAFVNFLNRLSTALKSADSSYTLSVDVHGDGSKPFDFHVWGPQYKSSAVDKVITMATCASTQELLTLSCAYCVWFFCLLVA